MRGVITSAFREKKNGQDVHTINRLIVMGRMELEETLMLWKGASHVRASRPVEPCEENARAATAPARYRLRIPTPPAVSWLCSPCLLPRRLPPQVTNWFESAVEKSKVMAKPKPAFLDNFFAGK